MQRMAKTKVKTLSGNAIVEALKNVHVKRAVRKEMDTARKRLNQRMGQERYDLIRQGMTEAAKRDFDARVRLLRGE